MDAILIHELTIGAVYATLDRVEAKGLVRSTRRRSEGGGPTRRVFAVTAAGVRALADTQAMRERLWQGIDLPRPLTVREGLPPIFWGLRGPRAWGQVAWVASHARANATHHAPAVHRAAAGR